MLLSKLDEEKVLIFKLPNFAQCVEFVDEKLHQIVASDGSKANATIITASLGDGNFNLSSLDDGILIENTRDNCSSRNVLNPISLFMFMEMINVKSLFCCKQSFI